VVALLLVGCRGRAEPALDEVGTAVALTVAAVNAAGTPVADLSPTPIIATPAITIAGEGLPTAIPTVVPPTVVPTTVVPPTVASPTAGVPATLPPPTPTLAPPTATLVPPTATLPPPTATEIVRLPPVLGNAAVGGENFPADHVYGTVIIDPAFLIRMAVRDANFFAAEGDVDGAGIDHVEFFIADADVFPV
jgi:hypothetical protein